MAVTISEPPKSSNDDGSGPTTIAEKIYAHFDAYQHDTTTSSTTNNNSSAARAAKELKIDLKSANIYEGEEGGTEIEQITSALLIVLDNTMSLIINAKKKDSYSDSVSSVLQLLAAFVCKENYSTSNQSIIRAIIERTIEYTTVDKDTIRLESTKLLGLFSNYLVEGSLKVKPSGILKKKKKGDVKKGGVKVSAEGEEEVKGSSSKGVVQVDSWLMECLTLISNTLTPRITDKIAKVRYSAIEAVATLLSSEGAVKLLVGDESSEEGSEEGSEEKEKLTEAINNIQSKLLWIISNDTSATNRALVTTILPTSNNNNTDNVQAIIVRIKDVDMKVRECALNSLREYVTLDLLDEDDCVDILRYGLTKRCSTTYAKTVELLCTNWLKSTKFDPITLLDKLNPVLNETVCEQVAQVLLRVANSIDCESSVEKGVELVQKHYSGAEVRSLQQMVLKKRNIIADGGVAVKKADEDEDGEDNEDEDSTSPSSGMSPSMALFLRVKCESSTTTTDQISDIITDIPTLCNLLNTHIDKLIEFNNDEDYDEMDEDEAAAFEDDQNFVCLQLIHMAKSSDMEEGSRRHFISIMRRVLARLATPDDLVEACVKAMASAHDKEAHFLQTISEILVDVEDDDTFHSKEHDEKAIVIVRQMRIIAILSIVLESISGQMTEHPILDGFFQHLSPAITSKNAIVREHGVICLSKFCLLSGEDKVMEEFKPLLMTIAGSVEERVEVRAQAALALCDLSLIHKGMLGTSNGSRDDESSSFKSMLLEMLGHAKPGIVIIAAEITAKLLLSGRLSDPTLIAWLVLIYFDTSLTADFDENAADAAEEVKQVGSPVRLQQLLSIFFPTYSMSSLDANDDMMASIGPLLTIVNEKLSGMKQAEVKEVVAQQFPIAKMVEYVCYNVDLADKKKNEEETTNKTEKGETKDDEAATVTGDKSVAASTQGGDEEDAETKVAAENDEVTKKEEEEIITEASSTLLASIDVAEFLSEECDSAPTFYVRALAKILGSACIDVDTEDRALLRRLKSNVGEAEYANDDGPTVKSIKKLADLLVDVQDLVSDDEVSEEEEEEEDEALNAEEGEEVEEEEVENVASVEKENPRLSMTSVKSVTKVDGEDRRVSTSSNRASLGEVN